MIVYSPKIKEEVMAIQTEIKKNIQETNSEGKETRTQIHHLEQKEERNIQPEKNEETRIKKQRGKWTKTLGSVQMSHIKIMGMPERDEEEHEI